jgi:hypothetical protein
MVCVGSGGNWRGLNTACTPSNPCLSMGGACCFFDGSCIVFSNGLTCEVGVGGDWQGSGTTCSPNIPCPPAGACCNGIGCTFRIQSECPAPQAWRGPGTTCAPNLCQGACCETDGRCYILAAGECAVQNWHAGVPCSPDPCGPSAGACCIGTTCWLTRPMDCIGGFTGLGTTCTYSRCCAADFNQSQQLSVQDIFEFLAAYFAHDLAADFNSSGSLSVQDIFDFLGAYFAGCG